MDIFVQLSEHRRGIRCYLDLVIEVRDQNS